MSSLDSAQPEWTTARCFRLLRPILSRRSDAQATSDATQRNARSYKQSSTIRSKFGCSPNAQHDPDWIAKSRKMTSRQYSKSTTSSSDPVVDVKIGALSIPTPEIQRFHGLPVNVLHASSSTREERLSSRDIFTEKFLSQSDQVNFRSQKLVQGAMDLIEATNTCSNPNAQEAFFPTRGARSLRAMCCKQYARRVVELEKEQENSSSELRFDVASEAYELLEETLGAGGGDYMRATAREYGLAIFERMLMSSNIQRAHAIALIRRMRKPQRSHAKHPSSAEAESLLAALFEASTTDVRCCGKDNTYAHILNSLAEVSNQLDAVEQVGFEFRQFRVLLKKSMPLCWLGSRRLTALWTCAFRSLLDVHQYPGRNGASGIDVEFFLETFVAIDCSLEAQAASAINLANSSVVPDYHGNIFGCPKCPKAAQARFLNTPKPSQPHCATNNSIGQQRLHTTLNNSISSLFAMLTSFIFATRYKPDGSGPHHCLGLTSLFTRLSMSVIEGIAQSSCSSANFPYHRGSAILSATLLIHLDQHQSTPGASTVSVNDLIQTLAEMDRKARATDACAGTLALLPEFIFSTISSAGRLLQSTGYDVLNAIVASLISASHSPQISPSNAVFLRDLAIASVDIFSERSQSDEASGLASTLKAELYGVRGMTDTGTPFQATPGPDRNREGLTWEDGIGEWVGSISPSGLLLEATNSIQEGCAAITSLHGGRCSEDSAMDSKTSLLTALELSVNIHGNAMKREKNEHGILSLLFFSSSPAKDVLPLSTDRTRSITQNRALPRRPLADRTNLKDAVRPISRRKNIDIKQPELGGGNFKRKRSHDDDDSEDSSEDELELPKQRRRHHVGRNVVFATKKVDQSDSTMEESDSSSMLVSTSLIANSRRRSRGTALRSVNAKNNFPRTKPIAGFASGELYDSDDELNNHVARQLRKCARSSY